MIKSYSNSTISLQYFDSIKWKKRLGKLSHKLQRSQNNQHWNANICSATVMAAATEKFIRQNKPVTPASQEIEIHSEDLTASQFAHLTGIKTKRDSAQSIYSDDFSDTDSEEDEDEDSYFSTQRTAKSYQPTSRRIWDSHFWQDSRKSLPNTTTTTTSSISFKETSTVPALDTQPLCRNKSEPGGSRVPSTVQKGRFKIVWGHEEQEEIGKPLVAPTTNCVEWKRKRANSNRSENSSSALNMQ